MDAQALGPLFVHPSTPHYLWIAAAIVALFAIVICVIGLVRGRLGPTAALNGLLVLPAVAFLLGNIVVMQESTSVEFCGSCHETMSPIVESAFEDNGSLASTHFRAGAVPSGEGCYQCHSGYGIWGNFDAKTAGVFHMLHTVMGTYEYPLAMRAPFDISSCLGCHAESQRFRDQVAHQDAGIQAALLSGEMGCAGVCHPAAHPAEVLTGAGGGQ